MYTIVELSKFAEKQITKLPEHIRKSYRKWVVSIEYLGLHETRKISGYHDEPLRGNREGQRSVRLNRSYRVIYIESESGQLEVISVIVMEVNKHEY